MMNLKKDIIRENNLKPASTKGYFESDQVQELLDYFNSDVQSKYVNMTMMNFFFKINLLVPAKIKVISNLKISDFTEDFERVKINGIWIKLPRALRRDIKDAISKLNGVKIEPDKLFFALFFNSSAYTETVFNAPLYYALKETGYSMENTKTASFPVEFIRNTGIVNMYKNGTELDIISKISGITLNSLEKLLNKLNVEFNDRLDEKINREICRVSYYQSI